MTQTQGLIKSNIRIPPQNLDSEKALLGSVLLKPDILHDINDTIQPECFYSEKHRTIFAVMLELFGKSTPIDVLSVSSRLKEREQLDRIGGNSYLADLVNVVPSASNAGHYAEIVHRKYTLRRLIDASDTISQLGYSESEELDHTLDRAEKMIYDVTQQVSTHKFVELGDTLHEAWDRIERLQKSDNELRGVSTGFKSLDAKLSGLQKADLIILAARPSMGKTSLALDIARKTACQNGVAVGIFSLEMSSQQLVDRMLSAESRVDAWKLRTGSMNSDSDFEQLRDALDRLSSAPIYIDDQPGANILKMRSVARRLKREKKLDLIIIDYLQLMNPTTTRGSDSMVQQITEISRSLKQLAREMDVPVLALSQLSRAVEQRGGKPRLSDLRDSGSIEQDADVVMFIHRDDKQNENSDKPNIAEIMIEKHRNGPTGKVELYFDEKRTTFLEIDKSGHGGGSESGGSDIDDF
ncbi:replicative DNA helicase [Candidatus Wolfebacteria bacterium]|nr:MAG: replicative DNA helicase [Candidatus Wolfebacteria bacterium]